RRTAAQITDHRRSLLCPRRERQRGRDETRNEIAPSHSITSAARASRVGGTLTPSALAVLRLMTSSNVVGCSTGRSAGFAPLSILSKYTAAPLFKWKKFGPYVRRIPAWVKVRPADTVASRCFNASAAILSG